MCRSIKTLREPYNAEVTDAEIEAAARQYVRKISGFHRPAAHNAEAFETAVAAVAEATRVLLASLVVRGATGAAAAQAAASAGSTESGAHRD